MQLYFTNAKRIFLRHNGILFTLYSTERIKIELKIETKSGKKMEI